MVDPQPESRVRQSLSRDTDFTRLRIGETVSQFGSTISREAQPLAALIVLGATPLQMGVLAAAAGVPVLVLGLPAGVWVDRLRRRAVMLWTDVGRAVLLVCIPVAAALGQLRFELLLVIAVLVGALTVFFDAAYQAFVPMRPTVAIAVAGGMLQLLWLVNSPLPRPGERQAESPEL